VRGGKLGRGGAGVKGLAGNLPSVTMPGALCAAVLNGPRSSGAPWSAKLISPVSNAASQAQYSNWPTGECPFPGRDNAFADTQLPTFTSASSAD